MKIFNTIKFRLIAWFGFLLIISTFNSLVVINYSIQEYYRSIAPQIITFIPSSRYFDESTRREIIKEIENERAEVRNRVLSSSVLAIVLQIAIAIAGSYFIIKKLLSPLEELTKVMNNLNEKLLYMQIDSTNNTEEINELARNFNSLMRRLNKVFTSQKQFVENVSHEVKTPLTIIKTNLDSIYLDNKVSKKEQNEAIKTSLNSINFLNKLVEDLMLLSFMDKESLKIEKVNVNKIINKIKKESQNIAGEKHLKLEIETKEKELNVSANAILLHRALANIVENAIKYSPKNSEIKIKSTNDNGFIEVEISDQGKGIPKKYWKKIFDRFFRIDKSRSRETGGSGLGLAITKEIIESFGGVIDIQQNKDNGSSFIIRIPYA